MLIKIFLFEGKLLSKLFVHIKVPVIKDKPKNSVKEELKVLSKVSFIKKIKLGFDKSIL